MKTVLFRWLAVAALLVAPALAWAQNDKPAVVVSISSIKENLADISYITELIGSADVGKIIRLTGGAYTQGLDRTRPIGVFVTLKEGDDPQSVIALPTTDLKRTLEAFEEFVGEPRDAGEGIQELGTNKTFFIKEVGTWVFVSEQFSYLKKVPADPAALLGDLPKKYNIAVQLNVRNIPESMRTWAVDELKNGFEQAADRNFSGDDGEQIERRLRENSLENMTRLIKESDQITLGLGIDPQKKVTYLDVAITAIEGSSLAKELTAQAGQKSAFTGFVQPDGAVTLNFAGPIGADDAAAMKGLIKDGKVKALEGIDNDPNLDGDSRPVAKDVLESLFSVLTSTVDGGKLDGGEVLMLNNKSLDFATGIHVVDGNKVGDAFRKLVTLAKNDPEFPAVKLDAFKHAGITFHKLTANVPAAEGDAQEIFGEKIDVYLGTSKSSLYVGFGKKAEALLKKVIDQSASGTDEKVEPLRVTVALLPFLKFAHSLDPNDDVKSVIEVLEANVDSGDKLRISSSVIPRGQQSRIEIDEGIIKAIGVALDNAGIEIPQNFELPNAQ